MKDKHGDLIISGDWAVYSREGNRLVDEDIVEVGHVFECHPERVYLQIRGGCFCCQESKRIEIVSDEEAMIWKLAE